MKLEPKTDGEFSKGISVNYWKPVDLAILSMMSLHMKTVLRLELILGAISWKRDYINMIVEKLLTLGLVVPVLQYTNCIFFSHKCLRLICYL